MDKKQFFKKDALLPTEEQCLLTKPFYRNSDVVYAHFNEGKDNDRFYFIPLYLEMIYSLAGIVSELAPDRVWLCSFIRCTLEQPNLFQYKCPKCGKTVLSFRYMGSPLSGRVDLEGYCDCGWRGFESVSGWFVWGESLRKMRDADRFRHARYIISHPEIEPATIEELLDMLK